MTVQNTSLEAYISIIPELGDIQQKVFDVIKDFKAVSNHEISNILNKPINSITPRTKELRDMGLVVCVDIKKDQITNRNVMVWGIK